MKRMKNEGKIIEFANIRDMLKNSAVEYGDNVAFCTKIKENKTVNYINTTYKEMLNQMNEIGTALIEKGFKNKRIAVIGDNSYKWVVSYFSIVNGVGIGVPLDKALEKDELESCIKRSDTELVFYDEKHSSVIEKIFQSGNTNIKEIVAMDFISEIGSKIEDLINLGKKLLDAGDRKYLDAEINRDEMSFLLFTSGTTAESKAVMLSQKNVMNNLFGMADFEVFFQKDINMVFLPLHHSFGMMGLLVFLSHGMKNVFCDGLKYIQSNLVEYKVTVFSSVPLLLESMYKKIMKAVAQQGMEKKIAFGLKLCNVCDKFGIHIRRKIFKPIIDQLGGNMRFIINGAAALDPIVAKGFNDFGILTVQGYGLTEMSPVISSENWEYIRAGSVGKTLPTVEAKVINADENGIGELVAKGDNVMMGYYNNEAATKEIINDGWLRTGDLAYFDKDNYLFLCGRKKNVIVMKNGKNVFPEEIETLINKLPYVEESMVFSMEKHHEFVIGAKIVYSKNYLSEKNITLDQLTKLVDVDIDTLNAGMPSYKSIRRYILSDIPTIKTTTAKTKRNLEIDQITKEMKKEDENAKL